MNEPRTLTEAITRLQDKLSELDWTDQVFGRAAVYEEKLAGQDKGQIKPMVYNPASRDYIDARPSDKYDCVIFFTATAPEKNDWSQEKGFGHAQSHIIRPRRAVTLYGWINLGKFEQFDDGSGFPELIKLDLKQTLKTMTGCVASIGDYQDESMREAFKPFQVSDLDRRYDLWPYACFSLQLTVYTIEKR